MNPMGIIYNGPPVATLESIAIPMGPQPCRRQPGVNSICGEYVKQYICVEELHSTSLRTNTIVKCTKETHIL